MSFEMWLETGHDASRPPREMHGPFNLERAVGFLIGARSCHPNEPLDNPIDNEARFVDDPAEAAHIPNALNNSVGLVESIPPWC